MEESETDAITGQLITDSQEKKKTKQTTPMLQSGRYGILASRTGPQKAPPHLHQHHRVIIKAALVLKQDDLIISFTNGVCNIMQNRVMVDLFFEIWPVSPDLNARPWSLAGDIPTNMMAEGSHISISNTSTCLFEKQYNWAGFQDKCKKGRTLHNPQLISVLQSHGMSHWQI